MAPTVLVGRITRRATFRALRRSQGRAARGPIRVRYLAPDPADATIWVRVGYAIPTSFGPAVERNRARRRLRAAVSEISAQVPPGRYLLSADRSVVEIGYPQVVRSVREAMAAATGRTALDRPTRTLSAETKPNGR